jgi:hypothetical protein
MYLGNILTKKSAGVNLLSSEVKPGWPVDRFKFVRGGGDTIVAERYVCDAAITIGGDS